MNEPTIPSLTEMATSLRKESKWHLMDRCMCCICKNLLNFYMVAEVPLVPLGFQHNNVYGTGAT